MIRLSLAYLLVAAGLLAIPSFALAQDATPQTLQTSIVQMFSAGDIVILNERGDAGEPGA